MQVIQSEKNNLSIIIIIAVIVSRLEVFLCGEQDWSLRNPPLEIERAGKYLVVFIHKTPF